MIVRESNLQDVAYLKDKLRQGDIDEVWASSHMNPVEALTFSYYLSKPSYTIEYKDKPVGMFGVVADPNDDDKGLIWMLGSDDLDKVAGYVLKDTDKFIEEFLEHYEELYNFVDARNEKAIRWLSHLGAVIDEAYPHGKDGLPFHKFTFRRLIYV